MPAHQIELRVAEEEDTKDVIRLSREAGLFQFPIWLWTLLIWMCWVRVAVAGQRVVAFESFVPIFCYAYLMQVAVAPSCQKQKIGTLLTTWILLRLEEEYRVRKVFACTWRRHVVDWCKKLGFHVVSCSRRKLWILGRTLVPRE